MARTFLVEAVPYDPATRAAVAVRLAGGGRLHYTHKGYTDWRAGVMAPPKVTAALGYDQTGFTGGAVPTVAAIGFFPAQPATTASLAALMWVGATLTVSTGDDAATVPTWTPQVAGTVAGYQVQKGAFIFTVSDLAGALAKPLVTATFAGTGGAEGGAEATGRVKRRSWGRCFNVEGRVLAKASNVYEFGDPAQPLSAFDQVRDKGRAGSQTVLGWQGSVAATLTALTGSSPAPGGCVVAPSIAAVKWWTAPAGPLTADLRGEIGAGYVETVAAIADRVAQAAGCPAVAALATVDSTRPDPAGLHVDDAGETAATVLDRLLLRASLAWSLGASGSLNLAPIAFGAPVETVAASLIEREAAYPPVTRFQVGYKRNHRVHTAAEISAAVLAGDVVLADGTTADAAIAGAQATASAALSAGASLIYNGDAELGSTDGWWNGPQSTGSGNQFVAISGEQARGAWSFRIQKGAAGNINSATARAIAVTPGQKMVLRAQTRGSDPSGAGTIFIRMMEAAAMPAGGYVTGSAYTELFNGGATTPFYQHQYSYTVPSGVYAVSPVIFNVAGGPTTFVLDDVQLFDAADFATVTGATRPDDNATRNRVTYSTTAPASPVNGDIWVDLNGTYAVFKLRNAGVWQVGANALTAYNALAGTPIALADINTTESTKLASVATGATADLKLVATSGAANVVITGNGAVVATGQAASLNSSTSITGPVQATFRSIGSGAVNGLATAGGDAITFHKSAGGAFYYYTSAEGFVSTGSSNPSDDTVFDVIYDGSNYIWKAGGGSMRVIAAAAGLTHKFLANMYDTSVASKAVADVLFRPYGDSTIVQPIVSKLDPTTGRALNARILRMWMTAGAAAAIYNVNPLSISRTSGVSTITINAHTITDDAGTISYSPGSIEGLTAAPGSQLAVFEDGAYTGGARTYVATLNATDLAGSPDRRYVGTVVVPADGATGAGAGNGQPGGRGTTNPLP